LLGASGAAVGLGLSGLGWGGLGGLVQPAVAEQLKKKEKQVLFIWIDGGMSQLESWDPKPGTQFGGPFRSIKTSLPGVHVSELMPRTAKLMHHLTLIRSMHTQDENHSSGVPRIQRGDPANRGVVYPYFGSSIAKLMGPMSSGLPPYVWVKPGSGGFKPMDAGFLGPRYGALAIGDGKAPENLLRPESISEEDDQARNSLRKKLNARYVARRRKINTQGNDYVFDMAHTLMKRRDVFDPSQYSDRDLDRYGRNAIGRDMLIGRHMIEAGVRFVKVNSYGWDTHGDNFNGHASLMPRFDQAFASVIEDLRDRGMLDHVLVIAMSEFGRTPRINGHIGRDHWPEAWTVAMAGCGLKRGVVIGKTNKTGTAIVGDEYDIGHMFHTWYKALGIDAKETEYMNGDQPLPIAHHKMHAIAEALA